MGRDLDMKRNIVDRLILISDIELKQFITSSQTQTCSMHISNIWWCAVGWLSYNKNRRHAGNELILR